MANDQATRACPQAHSKKVKHMEHFDATNSEKFKQDLVRSIFNEDFRQHLRGDSDGRHKVYYPVYEEVLQDRKYSQDRATSSSYKYRLEKYPKWYPDLHRRRGTVRLDHYTEPMPGRPVGPHPGHENEEFHSLLRVRPQASAHAAPGHSMVSSEFVSASQVPPQSFLSPSAPYPGQFRQPNPFAEQSRIGSIQGGPTRGASGPDPLRRSSQPVGQLPEG